MVRRAASARTAFPTARVGLERKLDGSQASWLHRLFHHRKPSTFQRCLAVHMHFAAPQRTMH
jgi:hypothetical protein